MSKPITPCFHDDTPEARELRFEQALVDAEIEGIARNPEGEGFLRRLYELGLSGEQRRARIRAYLHDKTGQTIAAE